MKIALIGYGKMGKVIERIALERGHTVLLKISSKNANDFTLDNLKECDVAIDFTTPELAINNIYKCFGANIPIVVGTTGWYDNFDLVVEKCKQQNQTFLHATNCSLGVNLFFELNNKLAKLMNSQNDYNVSIEEIHHKQKLDAPSGTAITLAEGLIDNYSKKNAWKCDEEVVGNELLISAVRKEGVPGTHSIKYNSEIDEIEIKHTAHNREGFAKGAVVAAEYIFNKKGVFTMKDVLFN